MQVFHPHYDGIMLTLSDWLSVKQGVEPTVHMLNVFSNMNTSHTQNIAMDAIINVFAVFSLYCIFILVFKCVQWRVTQYCKNKQQTQLHNDPQLTSSVNKK